MKIENNIERFEDIIEMEWPQKTLRPKMPLNQRAKIFLPFSALTGYEKSLDETLLEEVKKMERQVGMIKFDDIMEGEEI